jgi:hypothetical protein
MNDLDCITRLNAEAIGRNIPALRAQGHWVVVEYAGLSVIGSENFSGEGAEERARARLAELNASGNSTHGKLLEPSNTPAEA